MNAGEVSWIHLKKSGTGKSGYHESPIWRGVALPRARECGSNCVMSDNLRKTDIPWQWSVTGNALRGRPVEYIRAVLAEGGWDGVEGHNHVFAEERRSPAALA